MELISVNLARSIWFIPSGGINPRGKSFSPMIPWLAEKYKFMTIPSLQTPLDLTKGIKFENGELETKEGDKLLLDFTIFSDGLMAETRSSTCDSDVFLEEVLTNLSENFNLPHYKSILRKKVYLSQLYIKMDKSLELVNPRLKDISKYISDNIQGYEQPKYEVGGIHFWSDQIKPINAPIFTLERVVNAPFSENRYYSLSGLETEKHLEALGKIEEILSGNL